MIIKHGWVCQVWAIVGCLENTTIKRKKNYHYFYKWQTYYYVFKIIKKPLLKYQDTPMCLYRCIYIGFTKNI